MWLILLAIGLMLPVLGSLLMFNVRLKDWCRHESEPPYPGL